MYKSRSFLLKKQKRGWCLRTQKKSLRKNPKLKRRNIKKKFSISKNHTAFIYRLALLVERERNSISALLRKERGLFSREEEEGVGSVFSPKVVGV